MYVFIFGAIPNLKEFKDWRPSNNIHDLRDPLAGHPKGEYRTRLPDYLLLLRP